MGSDPSSITTASIIRSGQLPQPQLGIIGEIERAIKTLSRTQPIKERICEYIMQEVRYWSPFRSTYSLLHFAFGVPICMFFNYINECLVF